MTAQIAQFPARNNSAYSHTSNASPSFSTV